MFGIQQTMSSDLAQLRLNFFQEHSSEESEPGFPLIYRSKLVNPKVVEEYKLRGVEVGSPPKGKVAHKVLMVVGKSGSGKTTFLNSLYNYIMGVEYSDPFRVKLVDEEINKSQTQSQTKWVTAYTIYHQPWFKIDYTLTIIDTPGFGDTDGVERDQVTTGQMGKFFGSADIFQIDHIDMIGFVAKSSTTRLSATEKYILESVMSLFGKDIRDNICMFLTFSDASKPSILASLEELKVPYRKYFKCNNSGILDCRKDDEDDFALSQFLWVSTFKTLGTILQEVANIEPKHFGLSQEVVVARQTLEKMANKIKENILEATHFLEQQKLEKQLLQKHEQDINANVSFTYTVRERRKELCHTDQWTTNCTVCEKTCCENCTIYSWKYFCQCMDWFGYCKECGCSSEKHKNQQYVYRVRYEDVPKTNEDLKRKYVDSSQKAISAKEMIKQCDAEIKKRKEESIAAIKRGYACQKKLNDIALRPMGTSVPEYIDQLMEMETRTHENGAQERAKLLKELKENYDIVEMIAKSDESTEESLWKEASKKIGMQTEDGQSKIIGVLSKAFKK